MMIFMIHEPSFFHIKGMRNQSLFPTINYDPMYKKNHNHNQLKKKKQITPTTKINFPKALLFWISNVVGHKNQLINITTCWNLNSTSCLTDLLCFYDNTIQNYAFFFSYCFQIFKILMCPFPICCWVVGKI